MINFNVDFLNTFTVHILCTKNYVHIIILLSILLSLQCYDCCVSFVLLLVYWPPSLIWQSVRPKCIFSTCVAIPMSRQMSEQILFCAEGVLNSFLCSVDLVTGDVQCILWCNRHFITCYHARTHTRPFSVSHLRICNTEYKCLLKIILCVPCMRTYMYVCQANFTSHLLIQSLYQ